MKLTHGFLNNFIIVRSLCWINWFHERPSTFMRLQLLYQFLKRFVIPAIQFLHIREVYVRINLTVGTDVFVDVVRLRLENADASPVEPVLALVAANVKLGFVVRLLAEAIQFLRFPRVATLVADEFGHSLRHRLGYADAVAVIPIVTQITTDVKSENVIRLIKNDKISSR